MEKTCKLTTRHYVVLVHDINLRMAQIPPLFNDNQQLDESELLDSITNKAPIRHKEMMIPNGFNPETGYPETFVEHCKRANVMDNIAMYKFLPQTRTATPRKIKTFEEY